MKFNAIIFFLLGLAILNFEAIGQRKLPPPPPRPPARVIKSITVPSAPSGKNISSNKSTQATPTIVEKTTPSNYKEPKTLSNNIVTETASNPILEVKEWRQVFKGKI